MMKFYLPVIFFLSMFFSINIDAQGVTYYDQNWKPVFKSQASYYFVTLDGIPMYRMNGSVKYDRHLGKYKRRFTRRILKVVDPSNLLEINFQDSDHDSLYVGKLVKVYSRGEMYDYLCKSSDDSIDWPYKWMKSESGRCSDRWRELQDGEIGEIVWKFNNFKDSNGGNVFVILIDRLYVPIAGSGLTMIDLLSGSQVSIKKESLFRRLFHKKVHISGL